MRVHWIMRVHGIMGVHGIMRVQVILRVLLILRVHGRMKVLRRGITSVHLELRGRDSRTQDAGRREAAEIGRQATQGGAEIVER
jgi:hypothetical protein